MDWPKRILVYGCESCGGVGTAPALIHEEGCVPLREWHRWHEKAERGSIPPTQRECPVYVPIKMLAYVPGDEPTVDVTRTRRAEAGDMSRSDGLGG